MKAKIGGQMVDLEIEGRVRDGRIDTHQANATGLSGENSRKTMDGLGQNRNPLKMRTVLKTHSGIPLKRTESRFPQNSQKRALFPYRSKLEAAYSGYLQGLLLAGDIQSWSYEPIRLHLAVKTTLTPDFLVITKEGRLELHEVKGWAREDAMVKLKMAARLYSYWTFVLVKRVRGVWDIREMPV